MEQDFTKKITLVVRKDLETWQFANVVGHICAYLGHHIESDFSTGEAFVTKDNITYPRNSQYPIITKRAKSSEQLHNLMGKVRESGLLYHCFIREMIEHGNDAELQQSLPNKNDSDIEYLGVGVFGESGAVDRITKKFGLL